MSLQSSITPATFLLCVAIAATNSAVASGIHFVYMSPSDVAYSAKLEAGVENAARTLQAWFPGELGGKTFALNSDVVEWYQTPHNTSWYQTNPSSPAFYAGRFWESATADAFALTGGQFYDPDDIWVLYLDAMPLEGQYIGGTSSVALMAAHDLAGLKGDSSEPVSRWIGGSGHEMGHAVGLPHPPDSPGGPDDWSLMYYGYITFPNTYLRSADRQTLLKSGYFGNFFFGDMDGDGDVDNFDIQPFELALTDKDRYLAKYPSLDYSRRGDIDHDGDLDNFDIQAFEALLTGARDPSTSDAVPEPATWILLALGAITLVAARGKKGTRRLGRKLQ